MFSLLPILNQKGVNVAAGAKDSSQQKSYWVGCQSLNAAHNLGRETPRNSQIVARSEFLVAEKRKLDSNLCWNLEASMMSRV